MHRPLICPLLDTLTPLISPISVSSADLSISIITF